MSNALWLDGLNIIEESDTGAGKEFICTPKTAVEHCPKCGTVGHLYKHGIERVGYKDLNAYDTKVYIWVDVQRYRCRSCKVTFNQNVPHMDSRRQMTTRCFEYIVKAAIGDNYSEVARELGIHEKTVRDVCKEARPEQLSAREIVAPRILGIDELTLHRKRRSIFTDVGASRVLDLIDEMSRKGVELWLRALPKKERVGIVTIDMCPIYRDAVHAALPQAKVVVDKWHILKPVNEALDKVRNRVRRASTRSKKNPHKARRLLQARPWNLSPMRRMLLDGILKNEPLIFDAWTAKEDFYDIWECETQAEAEAAFAKWKANLPASVKEEFGDVAQTVENWHTEIFAYFDFPATNAYTEAANGLIKRLNRAGNGYSFEAIRAKALLMESPGKTRQCRICKKHFPGNVVKDMPFYSGDELIRKIPLCGNCTYHFHKNFERTFDMIVLDWLAKAILKSE